jgi:hypothetical protein
MQNSYMKLGMKLWILSGTYVYAVKIVFLGLANTTSKYLDNYILTYICNFMFFYIFVNT